MVRVLMCSSLVVDLCTKVDEEPISLLGQFREEGRMASQTFVFLDDFLCRVSMPWKTFLSSTRKGNWSVFQSSKGQLHPILFAYNRSTYAKYMPILLLLIKRLPDDVPKAFSQNHFVAKLSAGKFNSM